MTFKPTQVHVSQRLKAASLWSFYQEYKKLLRETETLGGFVLGNYTIATIVICPSMQRYSFFHYTSVSKQQRCIKGIAAHNMCDNKVKARIMLFFN